jgi:hypothetical protein
MEFVVPDPVLQVAVDIKPGSGRNPLNVRARGVVPVAVLGSDVLDVRDIDPATLALEGCAPRRVVVEALDDSGYEDLVMHVPVRQLAEVLGDVARGDVVELTLTGALYDGTPIEGRDTVLVLKPRRNANRQRGRKRL